MPEFLVELEAEARGFWAEALEVWSGGGWAMYAIAVIAMVMFLTGMTVLIKLRRTGFQRVPESVWRHWLDHPYERRGPVGQLLDMVTAAQTVKEATFRFDQIRASESVPFERDLKVMRVCVSAAPLVGLLGTVTGMLSTFGALSGGAGGDKTMAMIAGGISEALITTETGLVIALPGLFFQYQLTRSFERYRAFLSHLENVCIQSIHRCRLRQQGDDARRAARAHIASRLRAGLAKRAAAATT